MAALDTFEWFVSTTIKNPDEETKRYILRQREYLFSLRSEDERQRFVDEVIQELREMRKKSSAK